MRHASHRDRDAIVAEWLERNDEGVACVIGDPDFAGTDRVRALDPITAKGLEFDLVVVVESEVFGAGVFGAGITGAVDRYVSMTRATRELVILHPEGGRAGNPDERSTV